MGYAERLSAAYPDAQWSILGDDYKTLQWSPANVAPKPSEAALAALPDLGPLPPTISDRQFGQGLWHEGIITFAECEAFVSVGAIPAALQAIVDQLADDATGQPTPRKEAMILIKGAKEYAFTNPLVEAVRFALSQSDPKWTPVYLRDRWRAWAAL